MPNTLIGSDRAEKGEGPKNIGVFGCEIGVRALTPSNAIFGSKHPHFYWVSGARFELSRPGLGRNSANRREVCPVSVTRCQRGARTVEIESGRQIALVLSERVESRSHAA